jgi:hypothetical protein
MIDMDQVDPSAELRKNGSTIRAAIAIVAMGLLLLLSAAGAHRRLGR